MPDARDEGRDRELLQDLASGRREALAELYDRHAASLFRHALARARQQAEAEDLVQGSKRSAGKLDCRRMRPHRSRRTLSASSPRAAVREWMTVLGISAADGERR